MEHVIHEFDPVYNQDSKVLVLGTMGSPKSREVGFYYGHPRNRFWKVMAQVFAEAVPETIAAKKDFLLRNRIALWDVLASCDIQGASDSSIKHPVANDLNRILKVADINAIFTTGNKAAQLYRKLCEPVCRMPCTALPSTSPANCRMSDEILKQYYEQIRKCTQGGKKDDCR